MNVTHVITRLILGGAQENTLLTCEGLHERGHDVTLVTGPALGPEGQLMTRAEHGGYRVVVLDDLRREISPRRDWRVLRQLRQLLREARPDVVHTHSSKAGILGRRAARQVGGMAVVHTIHGLPFHPYQSGLKNRLYIALERRAARESDAILCVADAMTRQALAAGVGRPEQYKTVYSGMETQRFLNRPADVEAFRASLGVGPDDVLITQVSRLAELKGHDDLLTAAARLDDPRVRFCFVGDGHLRGHIERRIAEEGLAGRVCLTGLLPPERIPTVMHATDILAHCSYREGLARTLPQALLAGVPVVTYDVDGASEVCPPDGSTGILVPPADLGALEAGLRLLVDDPDLRRRLGQIGRARCRLRFDWRTMVDQIEAVYQRLVERS